MTHQPFKIYIKSAYADEFSKKAEEKTRQNQARSLYIT
jgi:hypothetical protein